MNYFLRILAGNIPRGAVLFFNQDLQVIFAEGEALGTLDISKDKIEGNHLRHIWPAGSFAKLLPYCLQTLRGETEEIQFQTSESPQKTYWMRFLPIPNRKGQTNWGLLAMVDISQMQDIQLRLITTQFELELKHRSLNNMLNILRHDIKGPLASIINICQLAKYSESHEDQTKLFDWIHKIAGRSLNFTQNILNKQQLPLVFEDIFSGIQEQFRFHRHFDHIRFQCRSQGSQTYYGNRIEHTSLLENLVLNSLNHHDISKTDPFIKLDIHYEKKHLELRYRDNGKGIPLQKLPFIFERRPPASADQSHGLGLTIVKEVIDSLEGEIQVHSTLGAGTEFVIKIPQHQTLIEEESPTENLSLSV